MALHADDVAAFIIRRFNKLKSTRQNWDTHWQQVADFCIPRKDDVFGQFSKGEKKHDKLYDSTAVHTAELLASALHSMLTNPATFFFELTTGDPLIDKLDEVRKWFQHVVERMHLRLNNSNFQTEIHELYLDLVTLGTGPMQILEDKEFVIRFLSHPIYQAYIAENNKGVVDEIYRTFKWTKKKIKDEFGQEIIEKLEAANFDFGKSDQDEFEIIHAVFPRDDFDNNKLPSNFKFASIHVLRQANMVISESGFKEFPYVVPRWVKIGGEVYGRSPAMKALADIKMLNAMMLVTIRSAQKIVDPPLMIPNDGVMLPIKTTPGGLNYIDRGGDDIRPLLTGGRIDISQEVMQDVRNRIRAAFFVDQLQLNEGPQMTATEVLQRTEEKLRLLGPILGRQQFELLRPLIDRVFNIMGRREGEFEKSPAILNGRNIQVQYSSQIAKAQRVSESQNLNRALSVVAPLIEHDPSGMDVFDTDKAVRHAAAIFGVSQDIMRTEDELEEIREARAEAQQQIQEQESRQAEAEIASKASNVSAIGG